MAPDWSEMGTLSATLVDVSARNMSVERNQHSEIARAGHPHLKELHAEGVLEHSREGRIILAGRIAAVLCDPDLGRAVAAMHVGQQLAEAPRH